MVAKYKSFADTVLVESVATILISQSGGTMVGLGGCAPNKRLRMS